MEVVPGSCAQCKSTGLPILPARYTVVPKALYPGLPAWASGERVKSVDLGAEYHYALRLLRTGFIYLFYEKHARGPRYWECYSVGEDGCLILQPTPRSAWPQATPDLQCRMHATNMQVHYIVIEQPEKCGRTWIAFSQEKWSEQAREQYTHNTELRNARMQAIYPARMIAGAAQAHGAIASRETLEQVLEYSMTVSTHTLPGLGRPGYISEDNGSFRVDRLEQLSTRYPWALRTEMGEATAKQMHSRAKAAGGAPGTPHVLALWDAIGTVHELNGFRNDAAGWIKIYGDERALEITALNAINGVKIALENQAATHADQQIDRVNQMQMSGPLAARELRARAGLRAKPGDPYWRHELAEVHAQRAQEAAASAKGAEVFKNTQVAQAWPKYAAKLNHVALDTFSRRSQAFFDAADALIDRRTIPLVKWLEAPLFIDTLEDFHPDEAADGIPFEDVVADAVFGLGSSSTGQKKIDEWIKEAKASVRGNLLWRAIALNQRQGIEEVDAALAHARGGVDIALTAENWGRIALDVKWNKLADVYKKAQTLANTNIKAADSGGMMKEAKALGFLRIFVSIGDRVIPAFAAKKVDSVVSEKIFQSLFLLRAGAHVDDVLDLAREQAARETVDRFAMIRRMQAVEAFANVMEDNITGRLRPNAEVLQSKWAKLAENADTPGSDGRFNAAKDARLAVVVAVLEAFNLSKAGYDAGVKKDAKSVVVLGSAVMGLAAAATDIYASVVKGVLEETSMTFQRLKFVGGVLSGGANILSAGVAFMDYERTVKNDRSGLVYLYAANSMLSLGGGIAGALSALTYCGPWLKRIAERQAENRAAFAVATRLSAGAATRLLMHRATLMAFGLALNLIALGIQSLIWYLSDDELQVWCEKCVFGVKRDENWKVNEMIEDFYKATYAVGVAV